MKKNSLFITVNVINYMLNLKLRPGSCSIKTDTNTSYRTIEIFTIYSSSSDNFNEIKHRPNMYAVVTVFNFIKNSKHYGEVVVEIDHCRRVARSCASLYRKHS